MNRPSRATDPSPHRPPIPRGRAPRATRVGLRTAVVILVATAFPVLDLRWGALALGLLGAALATGLGPCLSRRSGRLASSDPRLPGSQGEARQRLKQFLD